MDQQDSSVATPDYLQRTVAPHGLTGQELKRFSEAMHFMNLNARHGSRLWWLTTNKGLPRSMVADIWKRITKAQGKFRLPRYSALTFETRGGLHAHIAFIGNDEIAVRLRSCTFGQIIHVAVVTDSINLACRYLAKERTPQAGYGRQHVLGGRLRGSHRLEGGGDRVRLSRELERDAIEAGVVEPWKHTNARRSNMRKTYRPRPLTARAPRLSGQLPLLPELDRPVSRLHDFGGGIVPRAVAVELEFRRRRLGISQQDFAAMIGVSQGQYANAVRGHDPVSAFAINRVREIVRGEGRPRVDRTGRKACAMDEIPLTAADLFA
jgi:hypothetical protein